MGRTLWFSNGFWWFRSPDSGEVSEISSLLRKTRYDAEALAKALHIGNRSFRRMVKDSLGIAPGDWLRKECAVAIRHQLREGHLVKELAAYYGFKHSGDFSAEFKRWHDVNPSDFIAGQRSFQMERTSRRDSGHNSANSNFGQET